MTINIDLLIAAPMLQDSFVDKDGTPMSNGTITCYRDTSRTTLKNWYYQISQGGEYSYIPLPNPLRLSAAGTICDVTGTDTIPFFYPFSEADDTEEEPYYITIVNYERTNQITRENFPYNRTASGFNETIFNSENYIINNVFWRNLSQDQPAAGIDLTNKTNLVVAPSQHEVYRYPDIQFFKNVTGFSETLSFLQFPLSNDRAFQSGNDIVPEYYINHACTEQPTGETYKYYQFPISTHVKTLNGTLFTCTIDAQNALEGSGLGQNVINLEIFQDTGTGTTPPEPILISSITLNNDWEQYEFTTQFPTTGGLILSPCGDDALYLRVGMPLNITCSINFTRPSIYLAPAAPINNFQTYDQINSIICSPRTGDVRVSSNSFYNFGWLPLVNQQIGSVNATNAFYKGQQYWPLYNLLWSIGINYNTGSDSNYVIPMYSPESGGPQINYGSSAYADYIAGNGLLMIQTMGRALLGSAPQPVAGGSFNMACTIANNAGNIIVQVADAHYVFNGQPVIFSGASLPSNINKNYVYFALAPDIGTTPQTFAIALTIDAALAGGPVVGFVSGGTGMAYLNPTASTLGAYVSAPAQAAPVSQGVSGTGVASNIVQSSVFYNMYIKL